MHLRPAMVTAILWSLAVAIPLAMAGCVVTLASGVEDGRSPARTIAIVSLLAALGLLTFAGFRLRTRTAQLRRLAQLALILVGGHQVADGALLIAEGRTGTGVFWIAVGSLWLAFWALTLRLDTGPTPREPGVRR